MSRRFVRNIRDTVLTGPAKEPLYTNSQNDLLSDGENVYVRNKDEYVCITCNDGGGETEKELKLDVEKYLTTFLVQPEENIYFNGSGGRVSTNIILNFMNLLDIDYDLENKPQEEVTELLILIKDKIAWLYNNIKLNMFINGKKCNVNPLELKDIADIYEELHINIKWEERTTVQTYKKYDNSLNLIQFQFYFKHSYGSILTKQIVLHNEESGTQ